MRKAVAASWATAPRLTQARNAGWALGKGVAVAAFATTSAPTANGSPKTKRTKVAGSVPADLTRLRCAALRTVCAAAAASTIGIQIQLATVIGYARRATAPPPRDRERPRAAGSARGVATRRRRGQLLLDVDAVERVAAVRRELEVDH